MTKIETAPSVCHFLTGAGTRGFARRKLSSRTGPFTVRDVMENRRLRRTRTGPPSPIRLIETALSAKVLRTTSTFMTPPRSAGSQRGPCSPIPSRVNRDTSIRQFSERAFCVLTNCSFLPKAPVGKNCDPNGTTRDGLEGDAAMVGSGRQCEPDSGTVRLDPTRNRPWIVSPFLSFR
jgi:hypothetical protein